MSGCFLILSLEISLFKLPLRWEALCPQVALGPQRPSRGPCLRVSAVSTSPCPCTWASRLFQPVQYGQKPEGRTVAFPNTHPPRTATPATATATPQGHVRGRPPIATFSANPDAKGMLLRGLCSASQRVFVEEIPLALSPAPWGCVTTPLSRSGTVCSDSPRRPCVVLT